MVITGYEITRFIKSGVQVKVDDLNIPSYGADGALYTFRGSLERDLVIKPTNSVTISTLESVEMPTNLVGLLYIKSTYSRKGLVLVTNSPVDPGYIGKLTMRLFNSSNEVITLFKDGGIIQMVVHQLTNHVEAYKGRWMNGG